MTEVHFREGQMVRKGDPLIDIDPRPYEAAAEAQGTLERDTNLLAQAEMDLERYRRPGRETQSPSRSWTTRKRSSCRMKARSRPTRARCNSTRCSWLTATSRRPSPDASVCGWSIPATWCSQALLPGGGHAVAAHHRHLHHPEDNLGQMQPQLRHGKPLTVEALDRAADQNGLPETASTDNQIDTTTGTVKLRAVFDNKETRSSPTSS